MKMDGNSGSEADVNGKAGKTAAIVLAAGHGTRMHTQVAKQFLALAGKPVIYYSLEAFEESQVDLVILVTGAESVEYCKKEIVERYGFSKVATVVSGGKERYHSVYAGLCALQDFMDEGIVLIHDGARPMLTRDIIERTTDSAREYGACVAAMPVKDTIKVAGEGQFAVMTPDRSTLWQIQTPQAFSYRLVRDAYGRMLSDSRYQVGITDDAMVVESMTDKKVKLVEGSYENIKVTTPEDLPIAECLIQKRTK